jgi:rhodanese-related sulfurtransferase
MVFKKYVLLLMMIGLCFGCKKEESKATVSTIEMISAEEMANMEDMASVQLVDVRTVEEFVSGHIKGAQNIVYLSDTWSTEIEKLDKDDPVYVYCAKGGRSAKCAQLLADAGFKKVYDLEGGVSQWKEAGKPLQ